MAHNLFRCMMKHLNCVNKNMKQKLNELFTSLTVPSVKNRLVIAKESPLKPPDVVFVLYYYCMYKTHYTLWFVLTPERAR